MCRPPCQSSASPCDSGLECPCCVTDGVCGALDDGGMHRRAGPLLTIQLLSRQKSVQQPLCTGGELRRADDCLRSGVRMHMCPWYTLAWWDLRGSYVPVPITFKEVEGPVSVRKREPTESSIWSFTALLQIPIGSVCGPGLDPCVGRHHKVIQGLREGAS